MYGHCRDGGGYTPPHGPVAETDAALHKNSHGKCIKPREGGENARLQGN